MTEVAGAAGRFGLFGSVPKGPPAVVPRSRWKSLESIVTFPPALRVQELGS